ncbi:MAG TPA: alcohol dehydrogenase catalytic domain-containing protein [Candidatus Polarisedimenticolaceae bacterium]|nr:alcohol dehydrogenase catalytic domain-containing protein [Candidatus Polarisedimenticolaceae bacterium]
MKVAVYRNNDDIRIEDRPRPMAGAGEIVFRVRASGVCGSDVMEWYRVPRAPLVLGHEVAGEIEEVGAGIEDFRPGDRIVATHHVPCGSCHYCMTGREPVCETLRTTHFDPGGFSELVRLPAINVRLGTFRLPEGVSFDEGTFVEPLACIIRAQRVAGGVAGKTVLILGSGMSGLLHLMWARTRGASRVVCTDVHPYRLEAARRAGADEVLDASAPGGLPTCDVVIVCTAAPSAMTQAFDAVDRGGVVLVFALVPPGSAVQLPAFELWSRGVSIVPSYAGPPADMRAAIEAIAAKRVDVASLVTHRLPLERTAEAFRLVAAAQNSMKVLVIP